ncbi:MAG: ribokinase [Ruthenibacterium sp.]
MKILCIGSVNQDMVYKVHHFAVGGETITAQERNVYWGGKGLNQAVAAARACDAVYLAGCINRNEVDFYQFAQENKLHTDYLKVTDAPTGQAIICVDEKGQNSIVVYGGSNRTLTREYIEDTLTHFEKGDILLMQNETNALSDMLQLAHAKGMRLVMNPSPFDVSLLELPLDLVDVFLINEIEGFQMTGETQADAIMQALQKKFPQAEIVLTLGKDGVVYATREKVLHHGIYPVKVVDTTAAGDTFTGYFLSGLTRGLAPEQILEQASKASSIAVSRHGAASSIPSLNEVLRFQGE